MIRPMFVLMFLALAGCAGEPAAVQDGLAPAPPGAVPDANETVVVETVPVDWTDSLVRGAWACNAHIGCHFAPSARVYNAVFEQLLPVGNITDGNLSLTWDAVSEVTRELVLGYRIYDPACDECPSRYATEASGPSPIAIQFPPDMHVQEGEVLRLWVYGAMIEGESTTGTYVGLSDDQPFSVVGAAVVKHVA